MDVNEHERLSNITQITVKEQHFHNLQHAEFRDLKEAEEMPQHRRPWC